MPTKVQPVSDQSSCKNIELIFGSFKTYLRLCGFYISNNGIDGQPVTRSTRLLMIIYCVFCNLCALFNAVCSVIQFKSSEEIFTGLPVFIFYVEVACLSLSVTLTLPKCLPRFFKLFHSMKEKYAASDNYLSKLKTRTYVSIISLIGIDILINIGVLVVKELLLPDLQNFNAPFDQFPAPYGSVLNFVTSLFGTFSVYTMGILFNIVSYCLYKEFFLYLEKFKISYQERKQEFAHNFPGLWDEHITICELLNAAQAFLKHYIGITYLATIPALCFLVYALIKGRFSVEGMGFTGLVLLLCLIQIVNTTCLGVLVHDKAQEPLEIIYDSKWSYFSGETLQKISQFESRLKHGNIGYTFYGLFTIDRSTVLMTYQGKCEKMTNQEKSSKKNTRGNSVSYFNKGKKGTRL